MTEYENSTYNNVISQPNNNLPIENDNLFLNTETSNISNELDPSNTSNFEFNTPLRFFINKVWNSDIINNYDKGLNNLNKEFDNNIKINQDLEDSINYSGISLDNDFNKKRFGLFSSKKIDSVTFEKEDNKLYNLLDVYNNNNNILFTKNQNLINKYESVGLLRYLVGVKGKELFISSTDKNDRLIHYSIDFLDKINLNKDDDVINPYVSTDLLKFFSSFSIKNMEDISIIAKEEYLIKKLNYQGKITDINISEIYLFDIFSNIKNIKYFYNNIEIFIVENNILENNISVIGTEIDLNICNHISLVIKCGIDYYKILNEQNNTITYLNIINKNEVFPLFFKNWVSTNFTPTENYEVYIEIDGNNYIIYYNYESQYFYLKFDISNGNKDKNTNISLNKIFNLSKFTLINSKLNTNNEFVRVTLDRPIKEHINYTLVKENLEDKIKYFNYKNENVIINKINIFTDDVLGIIFSSRPTVSISVKDEYENIILNNSSIDYDNNTYYVTLKLNKKTNNFNFNDIIIINGSITSFYPSDYEYNLLFTSNNLLENKVEIIIPENIFTDEYGNYNLESRFNWFVNTNAFNINIFSNEIESNTISGLEEVNFYITSNRSINYFNINSINVLNGEISNFTGKDKQFTFTFIPNENGLCNILIPEYNFSDSNGISNQRSNIFKWTHNKQYFTSVDKSISNLFSNNIINHIYRMGESVDILINTINQTSLQAFHISNFINLTKDELENQNNSLFLNFELLNPIILENHFLNIDCDNIIDINEDKIIFLLNYTLNGLPYSQGLWEYSNNDLINSSYINIYKIMDISFNVILSKISINPLENNPDLSRLFMIFKLSDGFLYEKYYNVPDFITVKNVKYDLKKMFYNTNNINSKLIVEIIGEYLWNSNDLYEINTELNDPIRKNISIKYTVQNLLLSNETNEYWDSYDSLFDSSHFKFFELDGNIYGIIRYNSTSIDNDFSNPLIPSNGLNSSNINLNMTIKQDYLFTDKIIINDALFPQDFNSIISVLSYNIISLIKDETYNDYLSNIFSLDKFKNYDMFLEIEENNDGNIILNSIKITNISMSDTNIQLELDRVFIRENNSSIFNYRIIYKMKNLTIKKEEYSNVLSINTNNDHTLYLNKQTFNPYIQFLNSSYKEFTYKNTYTINFNFNALIDEKACLRKNVYILTNNIKYTAQIIILKLTDHNSLRYKMVISSKKKIDFFNLDSFEIIFENNNLNTYITNVNDSISALENLYTFNPYINSLYVRNTDNTTMLIRTKEENSWFFLFDNYNSLNGNANLRIKFNISNIINNSYYDIGFKKIPDTFRETTESIETIIKPQWIKEISTNLFKSIEFIIDDNIIEKLDFNTYNILYSFNYDIFRETSLDKIIRLRTDENNNYYFYFPLKFFFTNGSKYFPIFTIKNSNCKILFKFNTIENLLVNYKYFSDIPKIEFDINYSTIYLSDEAKLELGNHTKNYLAQVSYNYSDIIMNSERILNHLNINKLVKDIFIKLKYEISEKNLIQNTDSLFKEYLDSYSLFLNNPRTYRIENLFNYNIFINAAEEINTISNRVFLFKKNSVLSKIDYKFLIYIDEKYLGYINENLNDTNIFHNKKLTILTLYIKNIYNNTFSNKFNNNILENFKIIMNGKDISPMMNGNYYNDVIPYIKGYTLDDNYYVYSFGYDSKIKQPNGHLNFGAVNDITLHTEINKDISNASIQVYTKEYRIININNNKANIIS